MIATATGRDQFTGPGHRDGLYGAQLVITAVVKVPLKNQLGPAGGTDPPAARQRFESRWVRWNAVRSVLCTAAFGCLLWAVAVTGTA